MPFDGCPPDGQRFATCAARAPCCCCSMRRCCAAALLLSAAAARAPPAPRLRRRTSHKPTRIARLSVFPGKFPGDDSPVVWGVCTHAFHLQCINRCARARGAPAGAAAASASARACCPRWRLAADPGTARAQRTLPVPPMRRLPWQVAAEPGRAEVPLLPARLGVQAGGHRRRGLGHRLRPQQPPEAAKSVSQLAHAPARPPSGPAHAQWRSSFDCLTAGPTDPPPPSA